jgi:sulfate permease, SulP family
VGTIAASAAFDFAERGIAVIGPIPSGLPTIGLPAEVTWAETPLLLSTAAACFVVIVAQSTATSRVFALRHREQGDEDADILGLAAANAAASVSGAFVVNGSPTQTAIGDRAGAGSQFAQLVFAGIVLLVLVVGVGPLQYLPRPALAAIVFTIAVGMIDMRGLRGLRRESLGEYLLAIVTARGGRHGRCRGGHRAGDRLVPGLGRAPASRADDGAGGCQRNEAACSTCSKTSRVESIHFLPS